SEHELVDQGPAVAGGHLGDAVAAGLLEGLKQPVAEREGVVGDDGEVLGGGGTGGLPAIGRLVGGVVVAGTDDGARTDEGERRAGGGEGGRAAGARGSVVAGGHWCPPQVQGGAVTRRRAGLPRGENPDFLRRC